MTKNELFVLIKGLLVETFDLDAEAVIPEAHLLNDLDLDSIDAVDLIVKLRKEGLTEKNIEPETFKSVRTVQDVVDAVHAILRDETPAASN